MSEKYKKGGFSSEASRMLEAALEQMDGIIQGAKYELPQQFDNFNIQDTDNAIGGHSGMLVKEALVNLKEAILGCSSSEENGLALTDRETQDFLYNWLKNNRTNHNYSQKWWRNDQGNNLDLSDVEERMQELEREKDSLQLQVTVLEDQIENQAKKIEQLETSLQSKSEECRRMEEDRNYRHPGSADLKSEVANLRLKCAKLERDLTEYRNTTPKMQRSGHTAARSAHGVPPTSQPRSPTPVSSPDDTASPPVRNAGGGGTVMSEDEENGNDMDTSMVSLSGRSTRGLKKIFGKIKRSNSGGFECDRPGGSLVGQQTGGESTFQRGGTRATASARLGWTSGPGNENHYAGNANVNNRDRKRFSEWSVDQLCYWLDSIGLGQYTSDVQRYIGTGADLARLGNVELESRLSIKNSLHRKKLILAMQAKIDPNRPDPAGGLDCGWVVRWLDDIGLPQYKENFLDCRVDGRLLNLLTVDDLSYLKVSNLLHHLSVKRGIQVLRQKRFDGEFLRRRATNDVDDNVCMNWSNHRVMEWLREVDLAEYAPNLRGSGVHGALIVLEPRFNAELLASVLSIPTSKTLLRRHLSIHFSSLVGREVMAEKRNAEADPGYIPLTPTAKHRLLRYGQFTLKRKKSKSEFEAEDSLVCPLSPSTSAKHMAN